MIIKAMENHRKHPPRIFKGDRALGCFSTPFQGEQNDRPTAHDATILGCTLRAGDAAWPVAVDPCGNYTCAVMFTVR